MRKKTKQASLPPPSGLGQPMGPSPIVVRHFHLVFAILVGVLLTVLGTLVFLLTRPEVLLVIRTWIAQAKGEEPPSPVDVPTTVAPGIVEGTIEKKAVSLKFALVIIGGLALFGIFSMYFVVMHVRAQGRQDETLEAGFARRHAYLLGEILLAMSPSVLLIILSVLMAYLRMPGISVVLIALSSFVLIGFVGFFTVRRHWSKASQFTRFFLAAVPVTVLVIGSVLAYTQEEITIGNTLLVVALAWLFFIGSLIYIRLMAKEKDVNEVPLVRHLNAAAELAMFKNDPLGYMSETFWGSNKTKEKEKKSDDEDPGILGGIADAAQRGWGAVAEKAAELGTAFNNVMQNEIDAEEQVGHQEKEAKSNGDSGGLFSWFFSSNSEDK